MQNKTICIVGVLDANSSKFDLDNVSQARAFEKLGYKVIPVNYRTILSKYSQVYLQKLLMHVIEKYKPMLILFSKCNGVNPEVVRACTEKTTTWLWNMDPWATIQRCSEVIQHAKYATYSSCTYQNVVEKFKENGVINCHRILSGVNEDIYKPDKEYKEYKADFSFIGSKTTTRDKYKKIFKDNNINIKFYGAGYNKGLYNEDFTKICSSSKCMVSINTFTDTAGGITNRLLRYLSCGSCTLHLDTTDTLKDYLVDGKEIIIVKDEKELVQKMHKLSDNDIKIIGKAGRKRVLKDYTWKHTISNILNIIGT